MKQNILLFLLSFFVSIICGAIFIPVLKRIKAGQPILKYVETHKEKTGTPTMGGLFFIIPCIIVFLLVGNKGEISLITCLIGFGFLLVGFLDDFLKIKYKQNEGLKPYQKIIFQVLLSIVFGVFEYKFNLTYYIVPYFNTVIDLGFWVIPISAFILIAITNGVNLTDGLDGLAGSVSGINIIFFLIILAMQKNVNLMFLKDNEYQSVFNFSFIILGGILAFLIFNFPKASVFMGDTGSLSLGGIIGCLFMFSGNSLFIPLIGICFVVSLVSVILQVLYFKKTKKRIFLMSPFHHHLQMKGYKESKIVFIYCVITVIIGCTTVISYL